MGRILFVRIVAVVSGLLVASSIAFPSFPSTGFLSFTPSVAVDRTLKGDRLPLSAPTDKTEMPVQQYTARHWNSKQWRQPIN